MGTNLALPYGSASLSVSVPDQNIAGILTAKDVLGVSNEREELLKALRNPLDSPALKDCVQKDDKVVIITTDNTRHCPDHKLVPAILEELTRKVPGQNITIIIALGTHAPLTRDEMVQKLGKDIVENYRVINHDPEKTVFLGTTSFGTPVEVNATVVEADFRISTGFTEPHFFAGFSGGRKSIAPGVSSTRAIRHNHGYEMIAHPNARAGILEGNPVHEDMVEQAKMAGLNFILNVLLNKEKQITHVFAGNPWSAHKAACNAERQIVQAEIDHPVDITIVTNGGAPLDLDLYQTCKGIDTAAGITRPGGIIVAASSCHNGIGPEAFKNLHTSSGSPQEILEKIKLNHQGGVDWQNQILANAQLNHTIYLYSGLKDSEVSPMMITPIRSVEEGVDKALQILGGKAEIAVIPEGPLVLPKMRET